MTSALDPLVQHLVAVKAAIWPADWRALTTAATTARLAGMPRASFEETLLQAVLFYGFPRVVSAFEKFTAAWPATTPPTGGALPTHEQPAAGRDLFAAIYGKNTDAVHAMLASYHGEFHDFVLESAYGRVLTRPGLPPRTRELLAVAALAVMDQVPQLVAHARGALQFGASRDELGDVLRIALGDATRVASMLSRV